MPRSVLHYLCVCLSVCASFVARAHSGTKLVWHVCWGPHSMQFAPNPGHPDCYRFQNCAVALRAAPRWMPSVRAWFSSLTNHHRQNNYQLFNDNSETTCPQKQQIKMIFTNAMWYSHGALVWTEFIRTIDSCLTVTWSGLAFDCLQIMFTAQDLILYQCKFFTRWQLAIARITWKTCQMEYILLCTSNPVGWCDFSLTFCTLSESMDWWWNLIFCFWHIKHTHEA